MSPKAILDAKKKVSYNLHLLDVSVSSAYTDITPDITQACLQYSSRAARNESGAVDRFLEGVVSRLMSL